MDCSLGAANTISVAILSKSQPIKVIGLHFSYFANNQSFDVVLHKGSELVSKIGLISVLRLYEIESRSNGYTEHQKKLLKK